MAAKIKRNGSTAWNLRVAAGSVKGDKFGGAAFGVCIGGSWGFAQGYEAQGYDGEVLRKVAG